MVQATRSAGGPKAKVSNRSREVERDAELAVSVAFAAGDADRGPVKVRTAVLVDEPEIVVSYGKQAAVSFTIDWLDPSNPRWVADGPDGSTVVHGAGDVERVVSALRETAGVPDGRSPQPSKLTFGSSQPRDTTGSAR